MDNQQAPSPSTEPIQSVTPPSNKVETQTKKTNRWMILSIVLGILIVISYFGFYSYVISTSVNPHKVLDQAKKANTIPTPSPTGNPTDHWKTYTDKDLAVSFSYPPSWNTEKTSKGIRIKQDNHFGIVIDIEKYENIGVVDPKTFVAQNFYGDDKTIDEISASLKKEFLKSSVAKSLMIDGRNATHITGLILASGDTKQAIFIPNNNNAIIVYAPDESMYKPEEVSTILKQFFSTFKFIN